MFERMLIENHEARYEQLLREAELERLVRASRPQRRGPRVRALVRVADSMITFGQGLKERYQTASS